VPVNGNVSELSIKNVVMLRGTGNKNVNEDNVTMDTFSPTGWSKKTDTQFYFGDNFGNSAPILTILSLLQAEMYGA